MPFGIQQVPVIIITTGPSETTHPFPKSASSDVRAKLREPDEVLTVSDNTGEHLYPVRHIHGVTFTTSADERGASVELWQSLDFDRIYLRDPESPNAYEVVGPVVDGQFSQTAASLVAGRTVLVDGDRLRLHNGLEGLELVATWRPAGVELCKEGRNPVGGPPARNYVQK